MHSSILNSQAIIAQEPDQSCIKVSNNDAPDHSVHMRSRSTAHAHSPKRLSVFSGRSRSNTTTSTSSRRSPASSMTSVDAASILYSQDERVGSAAGVRPERQESMTKSLLSRGSRILRRQGSKFNIVATLDEEDEAEREKPRFEVSDIFSRQHRSRQSDAHEQLKNLISDPFDFHHLTHTSPSHFQAIEKARENDLVTEFSAIRASQRPVTGLKGIHAEDLHFRGFASDNLADSGAPIIEESSVPAAISPPGSPGEISVSVSPKQQSCKLRRESRIFENFSRPHPRVDATTPPPKTNPPRLAASPEILEPAPHAIDEILGLTSQPTYPEYVSSNEDDTQEPFYHMNVENILPTAIDRAILPNTEKGLLGARDSSISFTSLSSDLDDVPEEEEIAQLDKRLEFADENLSSSALSKPSQPEDKLQSALFISPESSLSIYVAEELPRRVSKALGSPTLPQYSKSEAPTHGQRGNGTIKRTHSVRRRATYEPIYESWDADIDYCYEHAAESNSNFDWARNSLDEPRQEMNITTSRMFPIGGNYQHEPLPSLELESGSFNPLFGAQTTSVPTNNSYGDGVAVTQRESDHFQPVCSSMFPPTLGKQLTRDTLYEEYLAADAESDRHFSFHSQGVIQPIEQPVSPRSSFSPISKCNSEESLILSRAASIVRKHRSSVSTTSVPELVHSLANSRELPAMDQATSGEHLLPSGLGRPESYHRSTKSFAKEIDPQTLIKADESTNLEPMELVPDLSSLVHDRAKSTSEIEAGPLVAKASKCEPPFRGTHRRKGRASYSLFPATAASNAVNP
ncbi:hypothetical protein BDV25DRAFT_20761 [Aspergillus avenaceus]|uniref:CRIB domain-containing protein n=1 Tax=Aspergillus avenaceus TaxID=36643 RepID=A0A5N6TPF5_ASPAV|nr:hypothetical protein BDV25DRAFT_20761 [Aspergillus avenaceus]